MDKPQSDGAPVEDDVNTEPTQRAPGELIREAIDKADSFQKDAPNGGTHSDEVNKPVWGETEGDLPGQEGKQLQQGGAPPGA
ncbi:MAG: hypothetical protein GEU28_01350 [Dehalococcoidia bacterium]|nr:hypothetical protein [Dehalococcoidia bacterium]